MPYDILLFLYLLLFQDNFAVQSNERGIAARDSGAFAWEIIPVSLFSLFRAKACQCNGTL
jgi:hypothetical protein